MKDILSAITAYREERGCDLKGRRIDSTYVTLRHSIKTSAYQLWVPLLDFVNRKYANDGTRQCHEVILDR